jgi:hypothetical protein
VALRKRNYSIYDISRALKEQGTPLGATAVREILLLCGFTASARRRSPIVRWAHKGTLADVRDFSLGPWELITRVGGLFLFVPDLVCFNCAALAVNAKLYSVARANANADPIDPLDGLEGDFQMIFPSFEVCPSTRYLSQLT